MIGFLQVTSPTLRQEYGLALAPLKIVQQSRSGLIAYINNPQHGRVKDAPQWVAVHHTEFQIVV